ncbi:MAG: recombinase family protein [Clostridium perfringens]|nr:recombinase family protein [Clostridium perfringens]
MKKIAIYSRKSVYTEGSISIESQVNMCKEYMLKKIPNSTFEIFEDEGFSGGNTNRPAFKKMIKAAELKQIDIVVCYKIDRIARNTLDFLNILEMFKANNVELISITEGFDPNTQMGKVMLTLLASFAEMERANIQQRVKDSMFSLAQKGDWTG